MKSLNKNNRNPKNGLTFEEVSECLLDSENGIETVDAEIKVGNNTYATWNYDGGINIRYHGTIVATIHEGSARVFSGGYRSKSTKERLDWVLLPLGYRMVQRRGTWKVYSIKTGAYRDFCDGQFYEEGKF